MQRTNSFAPSLFKWFDPLYLTLQRSTGSRTQEFLRRVLLHHPQTRFMTQRAEHLSESDHPLLQVVQTTADAADPAGGDRLAAAPTAVRGTHDHLPPHHATTPHSVSLSSHHVFTLVWCGYFSAFASAASAASADLSIKLIVWLSVRRLAPCKCSHVFAISGEVWIIKLLPYYRSHSQRFDYRNNFKIYLHIGLSFSLPLPKTITIWKLH